MHHNLYLTSRTPSRQPLLCVLAILLSPAFASAQFAPASLAVPSTVRWSGTFLDSEEGLLSETKTVNLTSPTNFTGSNGYGDSSTGTYSYTQTGPNQGTITYIAVYTYDEGDTENESGVVNLTFSSANSGTFTSSGYWAANGFNGTFSNGTGTFTYTPGNPAPEVSFVNKKANYTQTSASAPTLLNYTYHAALEGLAAPYAIAPTLGLPAGASPAIRIFCL